MGLIIRQSIKSSLSNYAGLIIGYINILYLMPKVFLPNEMGISRFIIDISGVLAGFASIGAGFSISRFFPKFRSKENTFHNGFTFWVYTLPFLGFALLCTLLLISGPSLINLLKNGGSNTTEYIHIILPLTAIMLMMLVTEQYCAQFGRIVVVNIVRENGLRIINLVLLVLVWQEIINFNQFIFCLLISYALALLVDLAYLFSINRLSFKPDFEFIKQNKFIKSDFFTYTGITLIGSLGPVIIARSDYFSVSMIGGDYSLGIYSMAMSIAIMTELPKRVILPIIQPVISSLIHEEKWTELKEVVRKGNINQVLIGMSILLAIWLNADSIFKIMPNGHKYESGKIIILILGIGKLFELASVLPGVIINNSHFFRWNLLVTFTCLVTMFIVYYFAVPIWGIKGTALGVSISYVAYALVNFSIVYRYYKIHWFESTWIKMVFILILILVIQELLPHFSNIWLDILVRSGSLLMLFAFSVLGLKLSQDLNTTLSQLIKGKFRWF